MHGPIHGQNAGFEKHHLCAELKVCVLCRAAAQNAPRRTANALRRGAGRFAPQRGAKRIP